MEKLTAAMIAVSILITSVDGMDFDCPGSPCYCVMKRFMETTVCMDVDFLHLPRGNIPSETKSIKLHNIFTDRLPSQIFYNLSLKSLIYIDLSGSSLQKVHKDTFFGLDQLNQVDLSLNNLTQVDPEMFVGNLLLRSLNLRGNVLGSLPQESPFLVNVSSLSRLDLRQNRLQVLPSSAFDGMVSLSYLDLDGNLLSSVELSLLVEHLPSLRFLELFNNPLFCYPFTKVCRIQNSDNLSGHQYCDNLQIGLKIGIDNCINSEVTTTSLASTTVTEHTMRLVTVNTTPVHTITSTFTDNISNATLIIESIIPSTDTPHSTRIVLVWGISAAVCCIGLMIVIAYVILSNKRKCRDLNDEVENIDDEEHNRPMIENN